MPSPASVVSGTSTFPSCRQCCASTCVASSLEIGKRGESMQPWAPATTLPTIAARTTLDMDARWAEQRTCRGRGGAAHASNAAVKKQHVRLGVVLATIIVAKTARAQDPELERARALFEEAGELERR